MNTLRPDQRAALEALLQRPAVARVLDVLNGAGEETRIVGGAVRNALLGRAATDVDMTTTALPAITTARARKAGLNLIPTGIEHGTVTVIADQTPFEVTTLREDVETDGRHAVVRFGRSFGADAHRRDFTINALSLGQDGRVHDPVGGLDDLAAGRVRFIGEARQRIREDYLRILRFFRFHAQYAIGPIDPEGFAASIAERDGLAQLSAERIRAELLKLLTAHRGLEVTQLLAESGLLLRLTGGVGEFGRLGRAARLDMAGPGGPDAVLRLAALLVLVPEDALRLRERLRLSNAESERLELYGALLTILHGRAEIDGLELRRLASQFGAGPLAETIGILAGEPRPLLTRDGEARWERYLAGAEAAPVFPLTGRDLVAHGVPPGPQIGRRLAAARQAWLEAGCPDDLARDDLIQTALAAS